MGQATVSNDLIETARTLAVAHRLHGRSKKPRQSDLKRAISTAYYALFSAIAAQASNCFAGNMASGNNAKSWGRIYRSLNHGNAKTICKQRMEPKLHFPVSLLTCASHFVTLQEARHDADYNPDYRTTYSLAISHINLAETAINDLSNARNQDKLHFFTLLLHKGRD